MKTMSYTSKPSIARLERLRDLLDAKTLTVEQAANATHIDQRWAREYLNHLVSIGDAHICGHILDIESSKRRYPRAIYAYGPGQAAQRPTPLTLRQRQKRREALVRKDPELWIERNAKRRARRFSPKPDKAAAWLMQP